MDNVGCEGTEDTLNDCSHNTEEDCGVTEGAGVVCDTRDVILNTGFRIRGGGKSSSGPIWCA